MHSDFNPDPCMHNARSLTANPCFNRFIVSDKSAVNTSISPRDIIHRDACFDIHLLTNQLAIFAHFLLYLACKKMSH